MALFNCVNVMLKIKQESQSRWSNNIKYLYLICTLKTPHKFVTQILKDPEKVNVIGSLLSFYLPQPSLHFHTGRLNN